MERHKMAVRYELERIIQKAAKPKLKVVGKIRLRKPRVIVAPLAVPIERGQTLRTSIAWRNVGTITYAFDVLSMIGEYDPATRTFYIEYGWVMMDVSLPAGESTTTNIDGIIPDYAKGGSRDGAVLIADYDPATGEITKIYAEFLTEDAISVVGAGAEVTGVSYSVV